MSSRDAVPPPLSPGHRPHLLQRLPVSDVPVGHGPHLGPVDLAGRRAADHRAPADVPAGQQHGARGHAGAAPHEEGHPHHGGPDHPGGPGDVHAPVGESREPLRLGRGSGNPGLRRHRSRGRLHQAPSPQGALGAREVRAAAGRGLRDSSGRVLATPGQRLGTAPGHSLLQGLARRTLAGCGSRSECW